MKLNITPEQENEIVKRFVNKQCSREDIRAQYKISDTSLSRIFKKHNVNDAKNKIRLEIVSKFITGKYKLADLSAEFSLHETAIRNILKKNGIDINFYLKNQLSQEERDLIINDYLDNKLNCNELGKKYNRSGTCIRMMLQKNGITLRNDCKYYFDSHYFDVIDSEEKAYFLGLLFADGWNDTKNREVGMALQEEDRYILERLRNNLQTEKPLFLKQPNEKSKQVKNQWFLKHRDHHFSENLALLGCVARKSLKLDFPNPNIFPNHLLRHFLRGYWDGNGSHNVYRGKDNQLRYRATVVSAKDFSQSLKSYLLSEINIEPKIYDFPTNDFTKTTIICGPAKVFKFLNWLYQDATVYLTRKYDKYINMKNSYKGRF